MPDYQELTDNEKNQIRISAIRNLEYAMYSAEIEILLEKVKTNTDQSKISELEAQIKEKENQKLALS